jgi:ubiquinone biosynthesis protein
VQEEGPGWATALPQIPRQIAQALKPGRNDALTFELRRLIRQQRRQTLLLGIIAASLVALFAWQLVSAW